MMINILILITARKEDLKQRTSHTINQKKDKHTILGSVAKTVDVKEAN